jgi:hypothetical protein
MTHHSGFADDDAHAVIDEDTVPNPGAWVNFDSCAPPCHLAEQPGQQGRKGPPELPKPMAQPMQGQSMEARVTQQDLQRSTRGWISLFDDRQIGTQGFEHRPILPNVARV